LVVAKDRLPGWIVALLLLFILFCSLSGRDLIGRNLWLGIASFRVTTFCIVGIFAIVLDGRRESVGLTTGKQSQP
jgi:hypothetical protein